MSNTENSVSVSLLTKDVNAVSFDAKAIENSILSAPRNVGGSFGPFSWTVDFHFDPSNIMNSYAVLKLSVLGISIIDGRLDKNNPKVAVDLTVAGVGVKGEVGIDFNARRVYFKGYLNFIFYKTDYDFTLFSF
jgi:hypothetical protein